MSGALSWIGLACLGAVGAGVRFAVDSLIERRAGGAFPLGTLTINLSGSFALGLLAGAALGSTTVFLVGTGLLGSYTTFSTWIFESEQLTDEGEYLLAAANLLGSAAAGFAAALAGWALGGAL
jgi:fluoride exporter